MAKILVWNSDTKYEIALVHESQMWPLLYFAFGTEVRLSPVRKLFRDDCERRDILVDNGPISGIRGHVTFLDC